MEDVGADDVSIVQGVGGAVTFADKYVGTGKNVTVTGLELSGADAGNHTLATATVVVQADILAVPGAVDVSEKGGIWHRFWRGTRWSRKHNSRQRSYGRHRSV